MENDAGTLKEEELVLKSKRNPAAKLLGFYEGVLEEAKAMLKALNLTYKSLQNFLKG